MLRLDLPPVGIGQAPVGQCGLAPARVEEADTGVLVGHVGHCRFDLWAVMPEVECCLPPLVGYEPMNRPHEPSLDRIGTPCRCDVLKGQLLETDNRVFISMSYKISREKSTKPLVLQVGELWPPFKTSQWLLQEFSGGLWAGGQPLLQNITPSGATRDSFRATCRATREKVHKTCVLDSFSGYGTACVL